jgi:glyoxylase-like metal-dependent hydrolase (beta-lactamase superfamily II)
MKKIQKNIYLYVTQTGINVGCILADDGVVLIDLPAHAAEVQALRAAVGELTKERIRGVVFTAPDRTTSEAVAAVNAPIVVHEAAMAHLRIPTEVMPSYDAYSGLGSYEPDFLPEMTFTDACTVTLGQKQPVFVDVQYVGGYAPGAAYVTVRDSGVLFVGEHAAIGQPAALAYGDFGKWSDALNTLKKNKKPTMLVPGRGPIGDVTSVSETLDYIKTAQSRVKELVRRNKSRGELATLVPDILAAYALKPGKNAKLPFDVTSITQIVRAGLERIYDDLKQEQAIGN